MDTADARAGNQLRSIRLGFNRAATRRSKRKVTVGTAKKIQRRDRLAMISEKRAPLVGGIECGNLLPESEDFESGIASTAKEDSDGGNE